MVDTVDMWKPEKPKAWHPLHYFTKDVQSVLDIGCHDGLVLRNARLLGAKELYGIDIDPHSINVAKQALADDPNAQVEQGSADELPFKEGSVDFSTCMEVLEHIPADLREKTIQEIHRVLKRDALFVITVPHKGLFAWADPANMRFRFPKLFSWLESFFSNKGRAEAYEGQKHGIVWHHHFTQQELRILLEPYFEIIHIRGQGCFFFPFVEWLLFPLYRLRMTDGFLYKSLKKLQLIDMHWSWGDDAAYGILMVCRCKKTKQSRAVA